MRAAIALREIRVLEDELVQPRAAEHPVVIQVDRVERVRAVAPVLGHAARRRRCRPASWCCGRSGPTGTAPAFRLRRHLAGEQVLAARRREHAVLAPGTGRASSPPASCPAGCARRRRSSAPCSGRSGRRTSRRTDSGGSPAWPTLFSFSVSRLRVHRLVAEAREPAAVRLVGAALGDDVHHAAVAAAVLGLVALGDEVELLDRLEREELQQAADGVVVVVAAVDLVVDVAAVAAGDLRRVLRALGRIASGSRGRRRGSSSRGSRTDGR